MKIIITISSLLNGLYMLIDGIYVMIKGKYIGPEKPGPWAGLFEKAGINVFQLGPLFISFGIAWLIFLAAYLTGQSWAYTAGLIISVLTLWYLPVGTILSLIVLLLLIFKKG